MLGKMLIIAVFILILFNLGMALFYMMKDRGQSNRTSKALTWRIGLSVALFLLLIMAYFTGLIQPHGIAPPT